MAKGAIFDNFKKLPASLFVTSRSPRSSEQTTELPSSSTPPPKLLTRCYWRTSPAPNFYKIPWTKFPKSRKLRI